MQVLRHRETAVTAEVCTHVPCADIRRTLRELGRLRAGGKQKDGKKKTDELPLRVDALPARHPR